MKYVVGAALAFSVCSNIWLWINLWNLKNELLAVDQPGIKNPPDAATSDGQGKKKRFKLSSWCYYTTPRGERQG